MYKKPILLLFVFVFLYSCKKQVLNFGEATVTSVDIMDNVFPDFSYAGYQQNQEPIPFIPTTITLEPGSDNDRRMIQNAIDELERRPLVNGFRGAILLKKGNYYVDNTLTIRSSGIVIRGEGQGESGTIIHSTNKAERWAKAATINQTNANNLIRYPLILVDGGGLQETTSNTINIQKDVKVGESRIELESTPSFQAGDTILITKTTNQQWIDIIQTEAFGWKYQDYQLEHRRVIKAVADNSVTLDIPMVDNIRAEEGGGTVQRISMPKRVQNVGIENIRLIATLDGATPEHHTWTAVQLDHVNNCWVRNMTVKHFSFAAVTINGKSDFNTIQDCAFLEPTSIVLSPRRYHFYIAGGMGNLVQRCFSEAGRHDFATSSRVAGPNVFLDCLSIESSNDIGPHHRWASGILFDNISGARLTAHNRGAAGSGHGWVGAQIMFWNSHATNSFTVESPPNAVNWCVGCTGSGLQGNGYWASQGVHVIPRSLFIYQLDKRIGATAANRIVSSHQRGDHNIWSQIDQWRGSDAALVRTNN